MSFDVSISVIIRTRNSDTVLRRCLASLKQQKNVSFDIIVVDSGSTDDTLLIAKAFECKVIPYPISDFAFNYSRALNLGIQQANGENILIVSSHVWLPNPNSVQWMLDKLHEDAAIKAVSLSRSKDVEQLTKEIQTPYGARITQDQFKGEGMYNYCSLIRKADWEKRSFREDLPTCEDQEWIWHWMKSSNACSYIFEVPLAGYDNPNYNFAKDVQEYYTMGKYVYPYYSSFSFLKELYKIAFQNFKKRRLQKARHYFLLANTLLRYKFLPPSSIQSDDYLKKII